MGAKWSVRTANGVITIMSVIAAAACGGPSPSESAAGTATPNAVSATAERDTDRRYLLERVDDAAVVQVYADGFDALPLNDKVLLWHLYQAAVAGRDIYYDQRHAQALEMRDVLEAIITA